MALRFLKLTPPRVRAGRRGGVAVAEQVLSSEAVADAADGPGGLLAAIGALRDALVGFEAELWSGAACAAAVERLAEAERLCASARARAAARAGECGAHRGRGFGSTAEWMARLAGTSTGAARAELETIAALGECPATAEAVAAGELSLAQAREITSTAAKVAGVEGELLSHARTHSLRGLKEKARRLRLDSIDPEELHRRQHAEQRFRHGTNEIGQIWGSFALPPEVGIPIINRLDVETDRLWRAGRSEGRTEPRDYYAALAFAAMLAGEGKPHHLRADVVFVCDLRAYRRGHAHEGEPCHVIGGGPVPVHVVRDAVEADAFIKAVTHDGVDIHTVVHYGRYLKTELRTALELGSPPEFLGKSCDDGCGRRYGLQWDHHNPVANHGPTSLRNLKALSTPCHAEKTERDRQAGLLDNRIDKIPARAGPPG